MAVNIPNFTQTASGIVRALGQRVRDRRIATGLTQGELAQRVGVSRDLVARLELGANVGLEPLVRIAMALDAADGFAALFPPKDTRSLDEILAAERKPQRARRRNTR